MQHDGRWEEWPSIPIPLNAGTMGVWGMEPRAPASVSHVPHPAKHYGDGGREQGLGVFWQLRAEKAGHETS